MRLLSKDMFSAIDIRAVTTKDTKVHEGNARAGLLRLWAMHTGTGGTPVPHDPTDSLMADHEPLAFYIIAVGGAGSLGSPAALSGENIISAARSARTTMPPKR